VLLTILGSAAAEGWPALYCTCDACAEALRRGGKDIRRRTSYRLGEHIQIDFGPDTFSSSITFGLDTACITDLVLTHNHPDHFTPHELYYRREGFSRVPPENTLRVHGPQGVGDEIHSHLGDLDRYRLGFEALEPYHERELADGVTVVALPATHAPDIGGAYNYVFRVGEGELLIAHDTGWWTEEVWQYISSRRVTVALIDCTYGAKQERRGHMGAPDVVEFRDELMSRGALGEDCRVIANHFSHNGYWLHSDLEQFLNPEGIEVGFDGMTVDV